MSDEDTAAPVPPENKSGKPRRSERIPRPNWKNLAATILLQFRDGHATDMDTLLEVLGVYEEFREGWGFLPPHWNGLTSRALRARLL